MRTARTERLELRQQFMIPRPEENSWGKGRALDKERIIHEFVDYTPIMNKKGDEECMTKFLEKVKLNGVDMGLLPRGSAPKRKCSPRSKVSNIFTSGNNASLIREAFPNQKGVVVLKTAPVAKNLFDMLQDKIISDIEWEPTIVELLNP